jgi:ankyrin repeat protein
MQATEPFFEAVKSGDPRVVAELLDQDPGLVNARDQDGASPVLMAVYYNQPKVAELLVARGAPLDLFEAAATGQLERVRALVEAHPSTVNAYAPDGFQPLGLAAFFGHPQVAFYLLEHGAQVDSPSKNPQKVRPLHSAVAAGQLEIARALVERGADVNAVQQNSFTPLHGAAQNGQIEMVQLLIEHGANRAAQTADGKTAMDFAREGGHEDVVTRLKKGR